MNQKSSWIGAAAWSVVIVFIFVTSLAASWLTLKPLDFGFPLWYEILDIESAIKKYAPTNQYRKHFETTTSQEHKRLFHEISVAVHGDTGRLQQLRYHDKAGNPIDLLLRGPEITHLEDVAKLIRYFLWTAGVLGVSAMLLTLWLRQRAVPFPSAKKILSIQAIGLALIAGVIMVIGPVSVFYQLHIWLFPPEHQWFFYYHESLMTTLMWAPDVFGPIAIALFAVAIPYSLLGFWLAKR